DQGDTVNDRHDSTEPGRLEGRVEAHPRHEIDRRRRAAPVPLYEFRHLAHDDLLDIAAAREGLAHTGRIDVELDVRISAAQHIALKVDGNDEREGERASIHAPVDLVERDHRWLPEAGRKEGTRNPC